MIKAKDLKVGALYSGAISRTLICLISNTYKDNNCWFQTWLKLESQEIFQTDYGTENNLAVELIAESDR